MAGMMYQIKLVDLDTVEQQDIIIWARENCPSFRGLFVYETEFVRDDDPGNFEFVFEDEKDATLFGLKFGSH
jgi:hypothetical protein